MFMTSISFFFFFFFSSRRRHTRSLCDWSSDVCSSDLFETGIVAATYGNSPERFDEGREQRRGFRRLLRVQCFHGTAAQVFRQLVWQKGLDNRRQFIEPCGHKTPRGRFRVLDAARIIQDDVARFAARSVRARFGKLPKRMSQRSNGNTPNVRTEQDRGILAGKKFEPELIDKLFAVRVCRPGDGQRREMLRGVRTGIAAGLDDDVTQARDCRPDGGSGQRSTGDRKSVV